VADGVGGWSKYGIDPGLFSKELCINMAKIFKANLKKYVKNPR